MNDRKQLEDMLQSIEGVLWEADGDLEQLTFITEHVEQLTGYSSREWLSKKGLWRTLIHPDERNLITEYYKIKKSANKSGSFEYRIVKSSGEIIWVKDNVSLVESDQGTTIFRGIMLNNTGAVRQREIEKLEHDVLMLHSDLRNSLEDVLMAYLSGLESHFPQMHCSIHHIGNGRILGGLSPSLPSSYIDKFVGLVIGENEGSCGTAAATRRQVIVTDIANDFRWVKYAAIAAEYQLGACWSNPLVNAEGEVMATLAMYYRHPRSPSEEELLVMQKATGLLRIILENRQNAEIINEANLLMLQSQELARFGNWRWNIQHDIVSWSPALYAIYGLDRKDFKANFASYQALLHPDDRQRVQKTIESVIQSQQDTQFEERIIRPNGELRYLRSWAKLKVDESGVPVEMIGACLDITESVVQMQAIETQNQQLLEIAWMQSHSVRSPLTKIMALAELLHTTPANDPHQSKLLKYLLEAANEMDEQVKQINEKAVLCGDLEPKNY